MTSRVTYTHVIHIADLHIRTGDPDRARIQEYTYVFQEFLKIIEKLEPVQNGTAVTVIAGDVFHNKGRIESSGFQMFSRFLTQLSSLTPVYFICGNHDFRQEDLRIPDMLDSMLDPWAGTLGQTRIHYLRDTGIYEDGNIGFGLVSVKDALAEGNTSGLVRKLPAFPSPVQFSQNVQHRLALFHGTIRNGKMQNDHSATSAGLVTLEWFKGYDGILLGDIHKQQMGRTSEGVYWGYPGSLIQQDFGESLFGHGFLLWQLNGGATQCTAHHVPNPYGMLTVRKKMNEANQETLFVAMGNRRWTPLADAMAQHRKSFPKYPRIRVSGYTPNACEQVLREFLLEPQSIIPWMAALDDEDSNREEDEEGDIEMDGDADGAIQRDLEQLSTIATSEKWREYIQLVAPDLMQHGMVEEWLRAPETMNLPTVDGFGSNLLQKIEDRRSKFLKAFHVYQEAQGNVLTNVRNRIVLLQVAWDYTLCYGRGNVFDFQGIQGAIALLNGRNATGKSSFLDVLCLGLFGESAKSRIIMGKKMTAKIIHNKKPPNKRAMNIRVTFSVNDTNYEIVREFGVQADKTKVNQFGVELCEIVQHDGQLSRKMLREGTTAVNSWIERQLGSLESILLSNFITQLDQHNFFTLKQEDQKLLLERALRLEAVSAFGDLLHEARLAHSFVVNQMGAVVEANGCQEPKNIVESPDVLKQRLDQLDEEWKTMQKLRAEWRQDIVTDFAWDPQADYEKLQKDQLKILEQIGDITDAERHQAFEQKGARLQERKRLQDCIQSCQLEDPMDAEDYEKALEELAQAELHAEDWEGKRPPASEWTFEMLNRMKTEISDWEQDQAESMTDDTMASWKSRVAALEDIGISKKKPKTLKRNVKLSSDDWLTTFNTSKHCLDKLLKKPLSIEKTHEEYMGWKKRYAAWRKKYADVAKDEDTSLDDYVQDHKDLLSEIEAVQKYQSEQAQMNGIVQELIGELAEYESMPFNPECWACASQPWRKIFEEKSKKLEVRKKALKDIQSKLEKFQESVREMKTRAEELAQWIDWKRKYDAERVVWETEVTYWTDWKRRWNAHEEWVAAREDAEADMEEAMSHLWEEYQHKREWVTECERIGELRVIVEREWPVVETWKEWHDVHKKMQENVQYWKQVVQYMEWTHALQDVDDQLQVDERRCARISSWTKAMTRLNEAKAGIAMGKLRENQQTYDELEKMVQNVRMAYGHAQKEYERYKETVEIHGRQSQHWRTMQERERKLIELEQWFLGTDGGDGGYKQWIYTTKVIPMIQRELNRCLSYVEPLRMRIEYEKGSFTYYVEDGDRQPSLDKASGYQNFIISLCMRITLGRLGATRNDFRHLIIDEGFTSCDADNLGKMPEFLYGLLRAGDYDSILLMSHLEGIRESTQRRVDIVQEGCFSKITFGGPYITSTYPKMEKEESPTKAAKTVVDGDGAPKKRGRPKKVAAT